MFDLKSYLQSCCNSFSQSFLRCFDVLKLRKNVICLFYCLCVKSAKFLKLTMESETLAFATAGAFIYASLQLVHKFFKQTKMVVNASE